MLIIISPAKTLDYESPVRTRQFSEPEFLNESARLVKVMKKMTPEDISELMHVSSKIGELNFGRYLNWKKPFTLENARQALFAFKGDVYTGLEAESLTAPDLKYAQKHLRILSGLYGVLRPLDLMQPYRLEMGTGLETERGKNLYDFWGEVPTDAINDAIKEQRGEYLVNLASNEYYKVLKPRQIEAGIITPVFKDYKNGNYKIISFFAKKARGQMASWIIRNRVENPEKLREYDVDGYRYNEDLSTAAKPVFTRRQTN